MPSLVPNATPHPPLPQQQKPAPQPFNAQSTTSRPAPLGTMNGTWILDKTRGQPSMRGYLETMCVTPLAIEAHEKGEAEHDTIHIIEFTNTHFNIRKMSRVNDLELNLTLGEEFRQDLPGERVKTVLATSDSPGQNVRVVSRMPTMNGIANVVDTRSLMREGSILMLCQTLTITNERTGNVHTTVRYFLPYEGEVGAPAATAKGSGGKRNSGRGVSSIERSLGDDMDEDEDEED